MNALQPLLKCLSRKKALNVLNLLVKREMKFNDLVREVGAASEISRILKDFQKQSLVKKRELKDHLGTVMYALTDRGYKIKSILDQMGKS